MRPRFLVVFATVSLTLAGASVAAQDTSVEIARRALLAEADQAREAGNHAHALELAQRAGRIRMTPSLRLLLAQEHAALAHPLEALDSAGRCVREAQADPALTNRDRIMANCNALVTSMQSRVGSVVVRVPSPAPGGLRVRVQGTELQADLWGAAYPVNPGAVVVEATGAGGAFRREVQVAPGASEVVVVALANGTVPASASPAIALATPPTRGAIGSSGPGIGPWVLAGAGVALLGASAAFYALNQGAVSNRDAACNATGCDPSATGFNDSAATWRVLNNVSLGVGAAAVVGGAVWWVIARTRRGPPRAAWNVLVNPSGGVVLTVGGAL